MIYSREKITMWCADNFVQKIVYSLFYRIYCPLPVEVIKACQNQDRFALYFLPCSNFSIFIMSLWMLGLVVFFFFNTLAGIEGFTWKYSLLKNLAFVTVQEKVRKYSKKCFFEVEKRTFSLVLILLWVLGLGSCFWSLSRW